MNGQLYTNNTWRNAAGATVLQTVGTVTKDGDTPTGTLYLRGSNWYITGIPDIVEFTSGAFIQNAGVTAHGMFIKGTQRIPAIITASFNDSNVTVDNCSFTVTDVSGHVLASGTLLLRNTAGNYWIIEYAALEADVETGTVEATA